MLLGKPFAAAGRECQATPARAQVSQGTLVAVSEVGTEDYERIPRQIESIFV